MRRRPGIAGLQRDVQARVGRQHRHHHHPATHPPTPSHPLPLLFLKPQEQFKSAGEEVRRAALQQMKDQLVTFKSKLEEFAMQHKSDIRRDPVFRAQFHTMCANIGVDPLASNKVRGCVLGLPGSRLWAVHVCYLPACAAQQAGQHAP